MRRVVDNHGASICEQFLEDVPVYLSKITTDGDVALVALWIWIRGSMGRYDLGIGGTLFYVHLDIDVELIPEAMRVFISKK